MSFDLYFKWYFMYIFSSEGGYNFWPNRKNNQNDNVHLTMQNIWHPPNLVLTKCKNFNFTFGEHQIWHKLNMKIQNSEFGEHHIWHSPNGLHWRIGTLWVGFSLGIQPEGLDNHLCQWCVFYETIKSGTFLVPQLDALTQYDGGLVKFIGEEVAPICGIRSISIDGKHKMNGGYYVEGMRHSFLSFSHMCNSGYEVVFTNIGCMIRKGKARNLVAEGIRTSGNAHYIKDNNGNIYYLSQSNEFYLWHERMGHVNFYNMIKINNFKAVGDLPNIINPNDIVCREC